MINSTEHNYRRLISPSPFTQSYVIFSVPGYPEYGYVNSLTQSTNVGAPTGYVGSDVIGSSRLVKASNGYIYAYGLSFSSSGYADSLVAYRSINNGVTFTGMSKILTGLATGVDTNPCVSVAYNGTTYSMVINRASYSNVLSSSDAVNWVLSASYSATTIVKALWVPEKSMFYYPTTSSTWYTSTNGSSLSILAQDASNNAYLSDLIYCKGFNKFVKSTTNGTSFKESMYMSSDCINWSAVPGVVQHWGGIQSLAYSPELNKVYGAAVNNSSGAGTSQDILTNLSESIYINTIDTTEKRSVAWLTKSQAFVITRGTESSGTPHKDLWFSKDGINWSVIYNAYPAYSGAGLPSGWNSFNISAGTSAQNNILEI